jgi:hypothetical protein
MRYLFILLILLPLPVLAQPVRAQAIPEQFTAKVQRVSFSEERPRVNQKPDLPSPVKELSGSSEDSPASLGGIEVSKSKHRRPNPDIPEPMYFDLVRGLGAQRGELEINTLVRPEFGHPGGASWAPEIEFAFRDGYSVELEIPFENRTRDAFKLAFQGTINTFHRQRAIQGWQVIVERQHAARATRLDALHLMGNRFTNQWSMFCMQGVRKSFRRNGSGEWVGLFNPSVFFEARPSVVLGVESNFVFGRSRQRRCLLLPQAQIALPKGYFFEVGAGFERGAAQPIRMVTAVRLIKSFHFGR